MVGRLRGVEFQKPLYLIKRISQEKHRKMNHIQSNTWRAHILWFRQTRAEACIWLMRRAARAYLHLTVIGKTKQRLLHAGLRAKSFITLNKIGWKARDRTMECTTIVSRFRLRVNRAQNAITRRAESFKYLSIRGGDALRRRLEHDQYTTHQRYVNS